MLFKERRQQAGIRKSDLINETKLSRRTFERVENGGTTTPETAAKMVNALNKITGQHWRVDQFDFNFIRRN